MSYVAWHTNIAYSIFRVPIIRYAYMRLRLHVLLLVRGVREIGEHGSISRTVSHNLRFLRSYNTRNERLLLSSMCIENLQSAKSLIIGCRTEEELFLFRGYGIRDVSAVDIMSYSPRVDLGDMHALPYAESSFDFVFCSYTLSYSDNPRRAAAEIVRVAKDGGSVAIAIEYCPWDRREEIQEALLGYKLMPGEKLETVDDILTLFSPNVGNIFVRYDAERKLHHDVDGLISNPSPVITVFSIHK